MRLTARHLQLIEMLAKGMTNREIALALNITEGTVKQHLFALFKKLKAPNRAKAVILGMQWIQQNGMPMPAVPKPSTVTYLKKLVTSVVIVPRNAAPACLEEAALLDHLLAEMLAAAHPLVQALEGRLMDTRRGGIHVTWGMECSHVDDAQRACFFVQALHRWLEAESQLTVALAIDQQEEVHTWTARDAYFSPSYETALQMAHKAKAATVVVTDRFRNALGAMVPMTHSRYGWVLSMTKDPGHSTLPSSTTQHAVAWIEASWRTRTAAWLKFCGGTPRQREQALQQLASCFSGSDCQCLRLHLPSRASDAAVAHAVYTQLDAQASLRRRPQSYRAFFQHGDISTEKTIEAIRLLSLRGPLLLIISGQHAVMRWNSLLQTQDFAATWPNCSVVCVIADDESAAHLPLGLVSSARQEILWPQTHVAIDIESQKLQLLQWLDSQELSTKNELQEWLEYANEEKASELGLPQSLAAAPATNGANLRALLDELVIRPAVSSRHS